MATSGMAVLPQYQGDYYTLQRQQALADALMKGALTPQAPMQTVGSGQYQVMPRISPIAGLGQLAQGLLSAKMGQQVAQGYGQLGAKQWGSLIGMMGGQPQGGASAPSPQPDASSADAGAGDSAGMGTTPTAGTPVNGNAGQQAPVLSGQSGSPASNGNASSALNPLGMNPTMAAMYYMADPAKYMETQSAAYKPAEIVAQLRAAGIDPNSGLGHQLAQNLLAKSVAPDYVSLRPGGYALNKSTGVIQQMPHVPEGFTAVPGQNGQWQIVPVRGGLEAMGSSAAAKAGGQAQFQLHEVWDPNANNGQGGYVQQSVANIANAANGGAGAPTGGLAGIFAQQESSGGRAAPDNPLQIQQGTFNQYAQKGEFWNNPADRTAVAQRVLGVYSKKYGGDIGRIATAYFSGEGNVAPAGSPTPFLKNVSDKNGKSVASYVGDMYGRASGLGQPAQGGPMASQPSFGTQKGQEDLQGDLTKKWGVLNEANSQAQNTISYLSNIRELAGKAALGQQSDKINFVNGLLSLAGSEKATDAVTANNLLDKYSNQIVARLGTGGLGTDAARSILQSAYPNAHMTQGAINEAVDNLVGASQMTQAKARLLQGDYNARNPQSYNQKEMTFDQNADPRVWQFQNMNAQQRQAFKANMSADEQKRFGAQIRALVGLGVLK